MCRSTVGRVVALDGADALVDLDGVPRRASTLLIPDLVPGELVLVGVGTVLGRVSDTDLAALRALEADRPFPDPVPRSADQRSV